MALPVYTELSNFDTRVNGKKLELDFSIVLIIDSTSDPVDSINSVYQFMDKSKYTSEFILINLDKEGYKYDKLLSNVPVMRILLPQSHMSFSEAIVLGAVESLSRNVLFMDENCVIKTMNLEVMNMYLSESSFGLLLPLLVDKEDGVFPNIVKGRLKNGLLQTESMDIVGTSVTSLYPKYFCFILNREAFISRNIELTEYTDRGFVLLELGYKLWKEGFIASQARIFKVQYNGKMLGDFNVKWTDPDYIRFNYSNITSRDALKGRWIMAPAIIAQSIFSFKFSNISLLFGLIKNRRKNKQNNSSKPVEDLAIFSIINKER